MPTWNEILDSLQELQALIEEIQSVLGNPATEEARVVYITVT